MIVSLHGKCGKLHLECELHHGDDSPPVCLEYNGRLYFFEDDLGRLDSLGITKPLDLEVDADLEEDDYPDYYIQGEPVKL